MTRSAFSRPGHPSSSRTMRFARRSHRSRAPVLGTHGGRSGTYPGPARSMREGAVTSAGAGGIREAGSLPVERLRYEDLADGPEPSLVFGAHRLDAEPRELLTDVCAKLRREQMLDRVAVVALQEIEVEV